MLWFSPMRFGMGSFAVVSVSLLVLVMVGCPPSTVPERDGGVRCSSHADCNPPGYHCGNIYRCVQGVCSARPSIQACLDGAYPDAGTAPGNCASYEDCNPPGACGLVISCIDNRCEPGMPRIEIPCIDGGMEDGSADTSTTDVGVVDGSSRGGG